MADQLPYQPLEFGRHSKLTKNEAIKILRSQETLTIECIPFKPKGGEIFVIKATEDKQLNDRRATGHRFYQVKTNINILGLNE